MANVLTTNSTVQCSHQGAVATTSQEKLRVRGAPVLVEGSVVDARVDSCGNDPKCTIVKTVTRGKAAKLRSGGQPVLLQSIEGTTNAGTLSATAEQNKLRAGES
jgi:hypothetical protein